VILKSEGTHFSRLDITAGPDSRSEIRNGVQGEWIGSDGQPHRMASHNTLAPAAWFSPSVMLMAMGEPFAVISYVGKEKRNGIEVQHLRYHKQFLKPLTTLPSNVQQFVPDISSLSTVDLFLQAKSHLLLAIEFTLHPDNNTHCDIPVEVRYADYRLIDGVLIPFRVQRLILNGLDVDLSLESALVNSGISNSEFALRSGRGSK
jgi:hypothetical protein